MTRRVTVIGIFGMLFLLARVRGLADEPGTASRREQFLSAIARGDLAQVEELADRVDFTRIQNLPYYVLSSPNADVVEFVRAKRDLNISDLQIAAIRGDSREARRLLDGLDKCSRERALAEGYAWPVHSYSPLFLSVRRGHTEVVRELIAVDANVNESTFYTLTPLANAAERGHVHIVELLLKAGATVNSAPDGYTALMRACVGAQPETTRLLLEAGADPNRTRPDGQTALHFAAKSGNTECVHVLLQLGADVHKTDGQGEPLILLAIRTGRVKMVALLLEAGIDANVRGREKQTPPLHAAAAKGHPEIVRLLLEHGAEVNAEDSDGHTALWHAQVNRHGDIADLLTATGGRLGTPRPAAVPATSDKPNPPLADEQIEVNPNFEPAPMQEL